jgi:hypothetical protein
MHIYIYIYIYASYICICLYSCIHTYIHTYVHTCLLTFVLACIHNDQNQLRVMSKIISDGAAALLSVFISCNTVCIHSS